MAAPRRREPAARSPAEDATAHSATRTVLKFDSGRRAFTRAILVLAVSAGGLLAFAIYFFWNLL